MKVISLKEASKLAQDTLLNAEKQRLKIDKIYGYIDVCPLIWREGNKTILGGIVTEHDKDGCVVKSKTVKNFVGSAFVYRRVIA